MKYNRIVILMFFLVLITGCRAEYNINITDEVFTENININVEENSLEEQESLDFYLKENILAFSGNNKEFYYKTKKLPSQSGINLEFKYNDLSAFSVSSILNNCFLKSNISSDKENIYIKASGYSCQSYNYLVVSHAIINLTTNHVVTNHNADKVENNVYTWNLSENEKDISIVLNKRQKSETNSSNNNNNVNEHNLVKVDDEKTSKESIILIIMLLFVFGSSIVLLAIYKINKK